MCLKIVCGVEMDEQSPIEEVVLEFATMLLNQKLILGQLQSCYQEAKADSCSIVTRRGLLRPLYTLLLSTKWPSVVHYTLSKNSHFYSQKLEWSYPEKLEKDLHLCQVRISRVY